MSIESVIPSNHLSLCLPLLLLPSIFPSIVLSGGKVGADLNPGSEFHLLLSSLLHTMIKETNVVQISDYFTAAKVLLKET